jgi:hypothetical protein
MIMPPPPDEDDEQQLAQFAIRWIPHWFHVLVRWTLLFPLHVLYRHGPALLGVGFWEGRPTEDVCAAITGVDSRFWAMHRDACVQLIDRKFQSFALTLTVLLYFAFVACIFLTCLVRSLAVFRAGPHQ